MRVLLLGTGAADGWPSPFCTCPSCDDARTHGTVRGPTAALVDGQILLDAGPGVASAVARAGTHLRGLRHVAVTHAHPDHLDPALLLWLSWNPLPHDLHVWGPPAVVAACQPWVGPDARVVLHEIGPGQVHALTTDAGTWTLRVLPAAHAADGTDPLATEAVLFGLTAPDGRRLLYATDTGPLPPTALDAVADAGYDVALVEQTFGHHLDHGTGHLDLATFPRVLADLRGRGALTERTLVAAVHLGHHNPPEAELRRILAAWGVRLPADLDIIDTAVIDTDAPAARRTLVLGGSGSGKSAYAEALLAAHPDVTFIAPLAVDPADPEWADRVARHLARRPPEWRTRETLDAAEAVASAAPGTAVLLDSVGAWLAALLDVELGSAWGDHPLDEIRQTSVRAIEDLVAALRMTSGTIVLVSDEIGLGGHALTPAGRAFADVLGLAHQRLSAACETTTLVVAGRAVDLGGSR